MRTISDGAVCVTTPASPSAAITSEFRWLPARSRDWSWPTVAGRGGRSFSSCTGAQVRRQASGEARCHRRSTLEPLYRVPAPGLARLKCVWPERCARVVSRPSCGSWWARTSTGAPRCWRPWPPARPTLPRRSCGGPCARVLFGALCGDALYGRCERAASGEILATGWTIVVTSAPPAEWRNARPAVKKAATARPFAPLTTATYFFAAGAAAGAAGAAGGAGGASAFHVSRM